MRYTDKNTYASIPGGITISKSKWLYIRDLLNLSFSEKLYYNCQKAKIAEYLYNGDTQPALVVSTSPLIISAYSDEMDAVIMLRFPDALAEKYSLQEGTKLVTINVYWPKGSLGVVRDIFVGESYLGQYRDVIPVVALFFTDYEELISYRVDSISDQTWDRVNLLTKEYVESHPNLMRNGFFYLLR